DVFKAAVYIRELIVRAKEEEGKDIKIALVNEDNTPVMDEEGEVVFGDKTAVLERLTLTQLLDAIKQSTTRPKTYFAPSGGELSSKAGEMKNVIQTSFEILTTNPAVKTAVPEKYAFHEAVKQLESGKSILVVTAEASAVRDLNEIYGHTGFDLLRDEFGKAGYRYIEENSELLRDIGLSFDAYYNPYGGRWHYIFTVEDNYDKQSFKDFLSELLKSSLANAREKTEKSGLRNTEVFNMIMSASEPSAKDVDITETPAYTNIKQRVLLNKLFDIFRVKQVPKEVTDWLASKINSPPSEIIKGLEDHKTYLGINDVSEFEKTIDLVAQTEYFKEKIRGAIYNSRDLIVYAENGYFAENFIPWASRRIRNATDSSQNITKATPNDGIQRVFLLDEVAKNWISSAKNKYDIKDLFGYFGVPKHIPDYAKIEEELKSLENRIKDTPPGSEEFAQLVADAEKFSSKALSLNFETIYGVPIGINVINTLMRMFAEKLESQKQGKLFRINADFDFLSQTPVEMGDVLKLKGIPAINEEFRKAFADKKESLIVTVQKGAGDELVVVGYFEGSDDEFKRVIQKTFENIRIRLQKIEFNGTPIRYNVLTSSGSFEWKPSISAGVSSVSYLTDTGKIISEAELLDAKSEIAVQNSKDKGRSRISFFEDVVVGPEKLERRSLIPYIPNELFKRIPFVQEVFERQRVPQQKVTESNRADILSRVKGMSLDELEKSISEVAPEETNSLFYRIAFLELEGRKAKELLGRLRPETAPYAILLPLTQDQMLLEKGVFQNVASASRRIIEKKYGPNIRVSYYKKGDL
ncbi:MAG: hypothetical protein ABH869_00095, partial [Candidatus Omnitrophota bacterium]